MEWLGKESKIVDLFKKYKYFIVIVLFGVFLMMIPEEKEVSVPEEENIKYPFNNLQLSLEDILSKIEGAGKVNVLLTEYSGAETIYQTDEDESCTSESSDKRKNTVIISDGSRNETGLICRIISPQYKGAIVVCQGADRATVRLAIVEAVSKVTGLSSNQISVLKMK